MDIKNAERKGRHLSALTAEGGFRWGIRIVRKGEARLGGS